jgi:hypothetical protein
MSWQTALIGELRHPSQATVATRLQPNFVLRALIAWQTYSGAGCPNCNKERVKRGVRPKRGTNNHPEQLSLF